MKSVSMTILIAGALSTLPILGWAQNNTPVPPGGLIRIELNGPNPTRICARPAGLKISMVLNGMPCVVDGVISFQTSAPSSIHGKSAKVKGGVVNLPDCLQWYAAGRHSIRARTADGTFVGELNNIVVENLPSGIEIEILDPKGCSCARASAVMKIRVKVTCLLNGSRQPLANVCLSSAKSSGAVLYQCPLVTDENGVAECLCFTPFFHCRDHNEPPAGDPILQARFFVDTNGSGAHDAGETNSLLYPGPGLLLTSPCPQELIICSLQYLCLLASGVIVEPPPPPAVTADVIPAPVPTIPPQDLARLGAACKFLDEKVLKFVLDASKNGWYGKFSEVVKRLEHVSKLLSGIAVAEPVRKRLECVAEILRTNPDIKFLSFDREDRDGRITLQDQSQVATQVLLGGAKRNLLEPGDFNECTRPRVLAASTVGPFTAHPSDPANLMITLACLQEGRGRLTATIGFHESTTIIIGGDHSGDVVSTSDVIPGGSDFVESPLFVIDMSTGLTCLHGVCDVKRVTLSTTQPNVRKQFDDLQAFKDRIFFGYVGTPLKVSAQLGLLKGDPNPNDPALRAEYRFTDLKNILELTKEQEKQLKDDKAEFPGKETVSEDRPAEGAIQNHFVFTPTQSGIAFLRVFCDDDDDDTNNPERNNHDFMDVIIVVCDAKCTYTFSPPAAVGALTSAVFLVGKESFLMSEEEFNEKLKTTETNQKKILDQAKQQIDKCQSYFELKEDPVSSVDGSCQAVTAGGLGWAIATPRVVINVSSEGNRFVELVQMGNTKKKDLTEVSNVNKKRSRQSIRMECNCPHELILGSDRLRVELPHDRKVMGFMLMGATGDAHMTDFLTEEDARNLGTIKLILKAAKELAKLVGAKVPEWLDKIAEKVGDATLKIEGKNTLTMRGNINQSQGTIVYTSDLKYLQDSDAKTDERSFESHASGDRPFTVISRPMSDLEKPDFVADLDCDTSAACLGIGKRGAGELVIVNGWAYAGFMKCRDKCMFVAAVMAGTVNTSAPLKRIEKHAAFWTFVRELMETEFRKQAFVDAVDRCDLAEVSRIILKVQDEILLKKDSDYPKDEKTPVSQGKSGSDQ